MLTQESFSKDFPHELTNLKQWICWRLEPDPRGGKANKIPYNPMTSRRASSTNPETWTTLTAAADAKDRYNYTGIGFVFTKDDGFIGVDIDHCLDPDTGKLNDTAAEIIARVPQTYTEISPSSTGLHIFLRGAMPESGNKNSRSGVEMYGHSRYFTVTGNRFAEAPLSVADDDGALAWIHEQYIKPPKKEKAEGSGGGNSGSGGCRKKHKRGPLSDEDLLEKARDAGDGERFAELWEGRWQKNYGSQSEADMALSCKLAFWSGKDKEQMDRLFRQSALLRPKWDVVHHSGGATYGEETLVQAIERTENIYKPNRGDVVFQYEGCYFRAKGEGIYPITNFLFEPIEMLISDDETQLTAVLATTRGERFRQVLMTSDLSSSQRFKNLLSKRTMALSYFGTDGDLEPLKAFITGLPWEIKTGVKAMGIYEHGGKLVFVTSEGAVQDSGVAVGDIVQVEKYKGITSTILDNQLLTKPQLLTLGEWLLTFNEPAKTVSIIAWTVGCFIKPHLHNLGVKFPHLFLIGEAGSGKSNTLEHVILPVFSSTKIVAATQVTAFTLMKESASSNLVPQALDEFKPSKMDRYKISALYNHFRDSYDGHDGIRGRADLTTMSYTLIAPLVVAGVESPDEAAVRERSIELLFSKKDLQSEEYYNSFKGISENEKLMGVLGRSLLDIALRTEYREVQKWYDEALPYFSEKLPSRIIGNLACAYTGLRLLQKLSNVFELNWNDVFPLSLDLCRAHLIFAAQEYLLDGGEHNKSIVEQTFEIMSRMGLDRETEFAISADGTVLSLWLNHVYDHYTKYRKDFAIVGEVLGYSQFKKQLEHSNFFLEKNSPQRIGGEVRKVWRVDYEALQRVCDVSGFINTVIPLSNL